MAVHLPNFKVSYFEVPKCANTSLKYMFYELEYGKKFVASQTDESRKNIHRAAYPFRPFEKEENRTKPGYWKFSIVRSPLDRFLSFFSDWVIDRRQVGLKGGDVDFDDRNALRGCLSSFISDFDDYFDGSHLVRLHTRPLSYWLGGDPKFFDKIYDLKNIREAYSDLIEHTGSLPALPKAGTHGTKLPIDILAAEDVRKLKERFAEDYDVFGDYFEMN